MATLVSTQTNNRQEYKSVDLDPITYHCKDMRNCLQLAFQAAPSPYTATRVRQYAEQLLHKILSLGLSILSILL